MTAADFAALLRRRDKLQGEHETACAILEEEGPDQAQFNYRRCVKLYDALAAVQEQIDAALEAERVADERSDMANEARTAT